MAKRLVTTAELHEQLESLLAAAETGETVVVVGANANGQQVQRAVLLSAAAYQQLSGEEAAHHDRPPIEARVGGVAGGLVAGAGTTISSITGKPDVAKGARRLGRRVGRALAAGLDAMGDKKEAPKGKS